MDAAAACGAQVLSEIEYQRKLLGDAARNRSLHAALKKAIARAGPGCRVIDVGAGTGYLSFLARRLGAAHCTLIEYADTIKLARELARANRIDHLDFIQAHSADVRGIPKADIVISETLGNFALEENLLETLADARRFLKPRGLMIPAALEQFAAPVASARLHQALDIWSGIDDALDFSAARVIALNNMYVKAVEAAEVAAPAKRWDALALAPPAPKPASRREAELVWKAEEFAVPRVHGFALWWRVEWIAGIDLSTAPNAKPTHWQQIYLPLLTPIDIAAGDALELRLESDTRAQAGVRLRWQAARLRVDRREAVQALDTRRGRL